MIFGRTLILGFPLLVAGLGWWAVGTATHSHERSKDGIVVMLKQDAPLLNPFLPATEAERQIIDLVHAPLLRIDEKGGLQPALADLWRWTQDVTCWFADEATAKLAQELLQAQIDDKNRWAEWHLHTAQVRGNTLLLSFGEAATTGVRQALAIVEEVQPQPVAFWRIERTGALRADWDRFLAKWALAGQIRRVWFDGANACEFVVAGPAQRVLDELRAGLDAGTAPQFRLLGEAGALVEPVLDLDIRPGRVWHDGKPVTAKDAKATLEFLRAREWPLAVHEVLRQIQSLEAQNEGARLHITFRRRYGPALAALTDLPMLPAAWLRTHAEVKDMDFIEDAPPGAGSHRIAGRDARSLVLVPALSSPEQGRVEGQAAEMPRFLFSFAVSPMMTQIGMSTKAVDFVWPESAAGQVERGRLRLTPPRQRLVVLWNTRHVLLKNARFREALTLAVDTSVLQRVVPGHVGLADGSLFAPGLWYSTAAPRPPVDMEKARQILSDEGWPLDVEGVARGADQTFRFNLLTVKGDELRRRTAEELASQWRVLGAVVKIEEVQDAQALAQRLYQHEFDAVLLDQRLDPSWDQLPWWHSSQAKVGGTNFSGISDPQIDLQFEALAAEFDPANVPERVRALEARLLPLHPLLTLFTTQDAAAAIPARQPAEATDGQAEPVRSWTLRSLAAPARRAPTVPLIDLKLRSPE